MPNKASYTSPNKMMHVAYTAVFAGNGTFLSENITQDRKRFITQSKHILW